jgi:drug/metabolite transporter (DMT)-like permease
VPAFSRHAFGGAIAIAGAIAYGINIPAARVAGLGGVNGSNLAMQRGLVLVVVLAAFILLTGRSFRIRQGEAWRILAAGVCGGATAVGYLSSLNFVPVGIAVTIFYTFPLLLILMAPFTGGGRISPERIKVFLTAFAGIALCVGPSFEQFDWRGLALAFAAACSCALLFILTASIKQDRLTLIFWIQLFALPLIIPVAWLTGFSSLPSISGSMVAIMISAIGFYIGFTCQVIAGGKLRPATLGLIFLIEPVAAILAAAVFLGETMLTIQYIGVGLVLGGLALDIWRQRRDQPISAG